MLGNLNTTGARLVVAGLFLYGVTATVTLAAERAPADPDAYRLMNRAVQARATWDEAFPGFTADVQLNYQGEVQRGTVQVSREGAIKFSGLDGDPARAWAYEWFGEMVFHRAGGQSAADQYRDIRFVGHRNDPLGPMLATSDEFDSSFRVDGKVIRQVNRNLAPQGASPVGGPKRVRINVLATAGTPEGRVLPIQYVINYLDAEDQLTGVEAVSSRFVRLGGYNIPQWRRVITTGNKVITTGELTLSNHQLVNESQAAGW